ncbi:endolytic transglycosylase MltG [Chitinispirillales bacterium ANBcel5]|uniref:endolytic transglycosylase MltG n=1 Tax=Cellulosispirillum alkaliphilum TaxID=3039283 RepID=UPI002A526A7A|nr:endolytic transglycosylase MltG [Chitinispirillales bacterium ANBcel5]
MKKLIKIFISVFVIVIIGSAASFYYLYFPMDRGDEKVVLVIERGTSLSAVANYLEENQVITSSKALIAWMKLSGRDKKIQAGQFEFRQGQGALSVSEGLLNAQQIEVRVTVLEGLTVEQTAQRIASVIDIDTTKFIAICYDTNVVRELGIKDAPSLEGYLFPDTYHFPEDASERSIINRMVSRFKQLYKTLEGDSALVSKYSRHELLTVASIVEKEATLASERGKIAGVFHNRLIKGYPLGADPTVRYIFRKFDGPLYVSELNVDNPYNTRRFAGIPPGPICSPGLGAIQATLTPDSTDALYFVAKWDGTGAHDFSRTYREHNRKKLHYRRQNELRKQRGE